VTEYLQLKQSNCKNCYKCIRNCPVKSIRFGNNQANIISDECILCGRCFVVCPQNAKQIRDDIPAAKALIASGSPVYASVAPSFVANYHGVTLRSMENALKKLGFAGAEETALGAEMVKKQYDAMVDAARRDVIISSCCPTVNMLIQKYYPDALPYLAPVISPMLAHCADIKRRFGDVRTVFIGPCISKKKEAAGSPFVDCALTFEELSAWLESENISLEYEAEEAGFVSRLFPTAGGILHSMAAANADYAYLTVDGIENCAHAIEELLDGKPSRCFIEMSACAGSCVGGPAMDLTQRHPLRGALAVTRYAGQADAGVTCPPDALHHNYQPLATPRVHISDEAIADVLRQIGKTCPEDELNCGSCGYNTCREKAVAVLQGKANLTMCLPFLTE
jgi:iron only hydrogenase large subunit-like protein